MPRSGGRGGGGGKKGFSQYINQVERQPSGSGVQRHKKAQVAGGSKKKHEEEKEKECGLVQNIKSRVLRSSAP